jgi:hypothetical protein
MDAHFITVKVLGPTDIKLRISDTFIAPSKWTVNPFGGGGGVFHQVSSGGTKRPGIATA